MFNVPVEPAPLPTKLLHHPCEQAAVFVPSTTAPPEIVIRPTPQFPDWRIFVWACGLSVTKVPDPSIVIVPLAFASKPSAADNEPAVNDEPPRIDNVPVPPEPM